MIALVRGRMKLNVELKYNVPDPDLAPAVVEFLRRERCLDQAVITSLEYEAFRQVETTEPRLRTGHIYTAAVGDVLRTDEDFLSLNSSQATSRLVRRRDALGTAEVIALRLRVLFADPPRELNDPAAVDPI